MAQENRLRIVLGALLILLVAATATATTRNHFGAIFHHTSADDPEEVIERDFNLPDGSTINLASDLGSIRVNGGGSAVHVRVTKIARGVSQERARELFEQFEVDFDQGGRELTIEGRRARNRWGGNPLQVRYEVTIPRNMNVVLKTAGGSIRVSDIAGEARVSTSGGSINVDHIGGEVDARTSGGSISAEEVGGRTRLSTSGGSIRLQGIEADATVSTSGGSIDVDGVRGRLEAHTSGGSINIAGTRGPVDAGTSGGSVRAEFDEQPAGPVTLETSAGTVNLGLHEGISIDLDATASGGRVSSDLDIAGTVERQAIRGSIGGGGPLVRLRTHGGSIRISRH